MNDLVHVDKASLDALTESLRNQSIKLAEAQAKVAEQASTIAELRALLARSSTLSERTNNPATDGKERTQ